MLRGDGTEPSEEDTNAFYDQLREQEAMVAGENEEIDEEDGLNNNNIDPDRDAVNLSGSHEPPFRPSANDDQDFDEPDNLSVDEGLDQLDLEAEGYEEMERAQRDLLDEEGVLTQRSQDEVIDECPTPLPSLVPHLLLPLDQSSPGGSADLEQGSEQDVEQDPDQDTEWVTEELPSPTDDTETPPALLTSPKHGLSPTRLPTPPTQTHTPYHIPNPPSQPRPPADSLRQRPCSSGRAASATRTRARSLTSMPNGGVASPSHSVDGSLNDQGTPRVSPSARLLSARARSSLVDLPVGNVKQTARYRYWESDSKGEAEQAAPRVSARRDLKNAAEPAPEASPQSARRVTRIQSSRA
eukprot:TRINITY_DN1980_c0_g2_i1.p1 TRINITY_DN1980_c0_g2~~TRINITY_DN1980_c0_g2_i1.p1  ORF type:complete len:354 (+),score=84.13 TRINITY_DN1980_c0_g2_i1:367-1428(+)